MNNAFSTGKYLTEARLPVCPVGCVRLQNIEVKCTTTVSFLTVYSTGKVLLVSEKFFY